MLLKCQAALLLGVCSLAGAVRATTTTSTGSRSLAMAGGGSTAASGKARFITNKMCPYAQRAWIALEESGVPYNMEEVSLYGAGGKPGWFMALNPRGEVPVLVAADGTVVADSEAILDHLSRAGAPLHHPTSTPTSTSLRALVNTRVKPVGKRAVLGGGRAADAELQTVLREFSTALRGPWAAGEFFGAADASAFPFLWRLRSEFGLPGDGSCAALARWLDACEARPSVRRTLVRSWWWWW